ncbi:hypothetical protein MLPF_1777 [Mycobacterium lepromatosis]|nr:hypothetical protein MLPF_1777 [Mycobacterium lepromatosis]
MAADYSATGLIYDMVTALSTAFDYDVPARAAAQ